MQVLGVDIGGSGIKAAPVDVAAGSLTAERYRIETPRPAKPEAVAKAVEQIAGWFNWSLSAGPAGITFPGVVQYGVVQTAANMDKAWIGTDARALFAQAMGLDVTVLNDADAAGVAEMAFGAGASGAGAECPPGVSGTGRSRPGTTLLLTFGTGIGSALFTDGTLVPNTEFGHIEIRGKDAERRASAQVRELNHLSWGNWAGRVHEYLEHVEMLLSPNLIIIGGGVSKRAGKFLPFLDGIRAEIVPAALRNNAGIVGAALAAAQAPVAARGTAPGRVSP